MTQENVEKNREAKRLHCKL